MKKHRYLKIWITEAGAIRADFVEQDITPTKRVRAGGARVAESITVGVSDPLMSWAAEWSKTGIVPEAAKVVRS